MYTQGVSAAAMQTTIDALDGHIAAARHELLARAQGALAPGADAAPLEALAALAGAEGALPPGTPEARLASQAAELSALRSRGSALRSELSSVRAAAEMEAALADFRAQLEAGALTEAAWSALQLRRAAADAEGGAGTPGHHARRLAASAARCEQELRAALDAATPDAFDVCDSPPCATLSAALATGSPAAELWHALELAGGLEPAAARLAGAAAVTRKRRCRMRGRGRARLLRGRRPRAAAAAADPLTCRRLFPPIPQALLRPR